MIRLIYVSTASLEVSGNDLNAILSVSQKHNASAGITGLLAFNGRNFMQALEGGEAQVLDTMGRISADKRHSGIVVISNDVIDGRAFPDWSMRLAHATHAGDEAERMLVGDGLSAEYVAQLPQAVGKLFMNFNSLG